MSVFKGNWKTTLIGASSVIIGALSIFGVIDKDMKIELNEVMTSLSALIAGLISMFSAKDEFNRKNL